jgi:hypothetical protein
MPAAAQRGHATGGARPGVAGAIAGLARVVVAGRQGRLRERAGHVMRDAVLRSQMTIGRRRRSGRVPQRGARQGQQDQREQNRDGLPEPARAPRHAWLPLAHSAPA